MLIEQVELTLSHVDLGGLTESAAMTLFGNVNSHALVQGTGVTLSGVADADGHILYPGYFMTHLTVPPLQPLDQHRLWDTVAVGAQLRLFGGMIVDSTYLLGRPNEVPEDPELWDPGAFPVMRGGALFVRDDSRGGEPQPSAPRSNLVARLPRLSAPPDSVSNFARIQSQGSLDFGFTGNLRALAPIEHRVIPGADLAFGHALMFASFIKIMDRAERTFLLEHLFPPFVADLLSCLSVLERQTCYLNNCHEDAVILVSVRGELAACPPGLTGPPSIVPAAVLTLLMELYERGSNKLLVVSRVRKLLAIPSSRKTMLRDVERLVFRHSSG